MGRAIERFESDSVSSGDEDRRASIDSCPSSAESAFRELDDVFLQTQARIWVGEVLHTRLDEETPIADLLSDGKLLFELSRVIWKMLLTKCVNLRYSRAYFSESKVSGKSSWKYLAYSNVDSFLKICQMLGMTSIDLVSSSDVVEKRNTRRVCMSIRSFSMKARSRDLNVPDFDGVTYSIAMPTDMVGCIRRSLEKSQDQSIKSFDFCDPHKGGKLKFLQKSWDDGDVKCYDSYSEEFQDPENNYQGLGFDSPSSSISHDDASLLISDAEHSPNELTRSAECSPSKNSMSNDNHQVLEDVINEVSDCQLDMRSSYDASFAIIHPPTSQNSISCGIGIVDSEDKFEAHGYFSRPCTLVRQARDLDSICTDMKSISGYESEDTVKYDVSLDSSSSVIDKLQSDMKTEDINSTDYLPAVECQLKELSEDVIPLSTCSEHVHLPPVSFSDSDHWVNGGQHADESNTEVSFKELCGVPPVKDGEKCINHAMGGNDLMEFSCRGTSICNCVWRGNVSEETTVQQSVFRGHQSALYENPSVLDIPEDKHVLLSSVNIQPAGSVCGMLDVSDAYSDLTSSFKPVVGHHEVTQKSCVDAFKEKTELPLSANTELKESDCLLANHFEAETEKDGRVAHSVSLECADVPDIAVCVSDVDSLSDADHSVGDYKDGKFMSISTKANESGNDMEHDDVEAQNYHYPAVKGIADLEETAYAVGNVEEDEGKREKAKSCHKTKEPKSHKKVLLKSVAGGVTLIGVFYFFFNRRRSGNGDACDTSPLSIQVRKNAEPELSKPYGQKKGRINGVYPGDKLKFQH